MLKRALPLVVAFVVAASAAFVSGAVKPILTSAAAPGTLFAITGQTQSTLSRVDPAAGTITHLADFSGPSGQGQVTGLTGDPATHRIYGLRFTTIFIPPNNINVTVDILTIDSGTGALLNDAAINQNLFQIEFDPSSGSLIGLTQSGIVKIDPATGATTSLAALNTCCGGMALVPGTDTVYVSNTSFGPGNFSYQILTVHTGTGTVTSSPVQPGRLGFLTYDPAAKLLLTNDINNLYSVDPATGIETTIANFNTDITKTFTFAGAIDPSKHTAYVHLQPQGGFFSPPQDQVFSINDQTGAFTAGAVISDQLFSLYFEAQPQVTPESIKADVQSALASGAIDNAGVANSLLAKLNAAADALARAAASGARTNGCVTASNIYEAFIHEVTAQSTTGASGVRGHIAPSTAAQLIGEAQFLIGNCAAPAASQAPSAPPPPASGTSGPKLFAVFNEAQVVTLDPATGAHTTIADLTAPSFPGVGLGDLVSDARNHRLFTVQTTFSFDPFQSSTYQLVTVSTQGGGFTISPNLAQNVTLAFDSSTGNLFGVTQCCPVQVVKIDPSTGAESPFATTDLTQFSSVTVAAARHAIYITNPVFSTFPPTSSLTAVDTVSGAVSAGPNLAQGVFALAYDSSAGALFGKSFCCPTTVLRIDPTTGAESVVDPTDLGFGNSLAVDPTGHKLYVMEDQLGAFSFNQFVATINESGGVSLSTAIPFVGYIRSLAVEAVTITPQSIEDDVRSALASGAIDNPGVANSLLAKLDTAAEARAGSAASGARTNGCTTASNVYQAFINEVSAQSGTVASAARPHIAPSTGAQLITEAQFLIANCP